MKCRRPGVAKRTSGPLTEWQGLLQKTSSFSGSCHPQSHQRSWASPPMQRLYVAMPMFSNPQLLAPVMMMTTERKNTIRMMTMVKERTKMINMSLERTNALNCIKVCVHARAGLSCQVLPATLLMTKYYI